MINNKIIRIGTYNNFNFSKAEIKQFYEFKKKYEFIFVNSNVKTTIKNQNIPCIVTINPNIDTIYPIKGFTKNIKALRFKFVLTEKNLELLGKACIYARLLNKPLLITFFRARKKSTLQLLGLDRFFYSKSKNYFRLNSKGLEISIDKIIKLFKSYDILPLLFFCDLQGQGCKACKNCARLTFPKYQDLPIYELNLSSSNHCPYNCIDCFAKYVIIKNRGKINFDHIKQNKKMKGA